MKHLFTLVFLFAVCTSEAQRFKVIDTNQVAAGLNANGSHFWDDNLQSTFDIPKNTGLSTIRFAEFWIGGYDTLGNLYVAAQISRPAGYDFRAGPINSSGLTDPAYDKVWKLSLNQINAHIANYNNPGYVTPTDILTWPGNGDVNNGEAAQLAPYEDLNGNEIYEPLLGEYPCIRGDQAVYAIYCDQLDESIGVGIGENLMVEFHTMLYQYTSIPGKTYLDSTIFNHTVVHARGTIDFVDVYLANYVDFDIGQFYDDYMGSDVQRNMFFAYNGNGVDAQYGVDPPAQGVRLLKGPEAALNDSVDNNHNGVVDEPGERHGLYAVMTYSDITTNVGLPIFDDQFYQSLTARWKDSTHLVFNGSDGHVNSGAGPDCNFRYSWDTDPNHPAPFWDELAAGQGPVQRRGHGSVGPMTLSAGGKLEFDYAYLFGRKQFFGPLGGVTRIKEVSDSVAVWWNQQNYNCSSLTISLDEPEFEYSLFPNPASDRVTVGVNRAVRTEWTLVSVEGRVLKTGVFEGSENQIDLQGMASGSYFLKLAGEGFEKVEPLVVH